MQESRENYIDIWKAGAKLAFRIGDLVSLSMADIRATDPVEQVLHLVEEMTDKKRQICKVLNQASSAVTMRYIVIDLRDIDQSHMDLEL